MKIKAMRKSNTIIALVALVFASSCAAVLPANTPNVPLLREKGEGRISGGIVRGEAGIGANFQAAYSPAKKMYMGASGSLMGYGDGLRSNMMEVSMGTYQPLNKKWLWDLSGGAGIGANNTWNDNRNSRLFLQSALGYTGESFEFAAGGRLVNTAFTVQDKNKSGDPNYIDENFNAKTFEPFVLLRFGSSNVRFQTILAYPLLLKDEAFVIPEKTITMGLHFKIGKNK
jgi:hypothetical protein